MFDPIYLPATWHLNLKNNFNIAKVLFLDLIIFPILIMNYKPNSRVSLNYLNNINYTYIIVLGEKKHNYPTEFENQYVQLHKIFDT